MFVLDKTFLPSLIFENKVRVYLSGATALFANVRWFKHSSLFVGSIIGEGKCYINKIDACHQGYKTFFFAKAIKDKMKEHLSFAV